MKKLLSFFLSAAVAINMLIYFPTSVSAVNGSAVFNINTEDSTGKGIENIVGYMNSWGYDGLRNVQSDGETDLSFVDYIEIMTATGGSDERDLIDAQGNMIVSRLNALAEACQGIINLGAKPLLKLGCIPFYFSMKANPGKATGGSFGYNVFPPDDDKYYEYQLYLENVIQYMIDRFGIDEVRSWRFGVMTEYENDEWFYVLNSRGKIDANATMEAFFKIYDHSVLALENKLGAEYVFVGAHSMTVTEGCWDERNFIDHAANGYNYAKGTYTGAQLDYLSFSFYDYKPEQYTSGMTLSQCVNFLRDYAVSRGLTNLKYGIDEGRILSGVNRGQGGDSLNSRSVGHMWQAGYDARMYKTMLDNDIDYFCVWSLSSDTAIGSGYPTVSYHVANSVSRMVGDERLTVTKSASGLSSGAEVEAISSYDRQTGTLKLISYNFKNSLSYSDAVDVSYRISMPEFAEKTVKVTFSPVDYDANYFDEWWADREKYGITDDKFNWSPDDPTIDSPVTLSDPGARDLYYNNLRDKYIECSKLKSYQYTVKLDSNGSAAISGSLGANMVSYYEIAPADELDIAAAAVKNLDENDYMDFSRVNELAEKVKNCPESERKALAEEINNAVQLLVKKKRTGSSVSENTNETNYPYAYLRCNLRINNAGSAVSEAFGSDNDSGSRVYFLDGNDTYDFNGFHVWQRTYQNTSGPSAIFYVDRYSYTDLSQLGNIINADFTTWGLNHQHSIGIADTHSKLIDGYNKSVSVTGSKGTAYSYSLSADNGLYSSGSETSFTYTPDTALIQSSKSAAVSGAVPQAGEQVTVRIGARTSVIDGYDWGNLLNYYCWTDVAFIGYDSSSLRQMISENAPDKGSYTESSFNNYMNAYRSAVYVLNNSYSQDEINSAQSTLADAVSKLVRVDSIIRGDVNLDGFVNSMDAVLVKCILSELLDESDFTDVQFTAADFDGSGIINQTDVDLIESKGLFL